MKKTGFDEMWGGGNTRSIRKPYLSFAKWVDEVSVDEMLVRQASAEQIFRKTGITFAVYSND